MNKIELSVSLTVKDFETVCSYLTENKITLTPKGDIGKIACYDLNSKMVFPVPGANKNHLIQKYPSIILYLTVALQTGLLEESRGAAQKAFLTKSESYALFQQMTIY